MAGAATAPPAGTGAPVANDAPPTGVLRLRAARLGARTVVTETFRTAPYHLGLPSYRADDGTAEVIVQQVGPGLFPDDRLVIEVVVEAGACLVVRGQGATKLYPSVTGVEARVVTRLRVASGGRPIYVPGELIPFRDAVCRQETEVELEPGARLALTEIITPGRVAMGERYAFRRLDLRLRVRVAGKPTLVERACLEPAIRPLDVLGRHGARGCTGSLYLFGYPDLFLGQSETGECPLWGNGTIGAMSVVRLLGETAQEVRDRQETLLRQAMTNDR